MELFKEQCRESTIRVLFAMGVVSLIIGLNNSDPAEQAWIEGVSIISACLLITLLSTMCNWLKEKQYLKLHEEILNEEVAVIRGQYGLS